MSIRSLVTAVFTATLAVVALSAPAQAQPAEHDHDGKILTLSVTDVDESLTPEDISVADHGDKGHTYPPDVDGYVPTQYGGDCYDNVLAYATWHSVGDWYIVYDKCEMERYGAGQSDWDRVGAHEKAHTDGWGHGEEPRARNAAFDPGIVICRC